MAKHNVSRLREAEFLKRQSVDARAEMARVLGEMRGSLGELADVRAWTQHHPKASIVAAVALGFAGAAAAAALLTRASAVSQADSLPAGKSAAPSRRASTTGRLLAGVLGPLAQLAFLLVKSAVAAWFRQQGACRLRPEAAPGDA